MKYILKEMTSEEKPREKLKAFGVQALADYELLAIILKTGTKEKSVLDLSIELMEVFSNLNMINELTLEELTSIKGIGEAKAMTFIAAIEFANRLLQGGQKEVYLRSSYDIYQYMKYDLVNEKQEKLICIYVNYQCKVISKRTINIGSLATSAADVKSCIKWGLKVSCHGIVFVHNHPSGDPKPSDYDDVVTRKFRLAATTVDIQFIDHIIIGRESYYSYSQGKITRESEMNEFYINNKTRIRRKL